MQVDDAAVDLGAAAAVADVGVHVVGEVQHRGSARQVHHLALRREQVHAVVEQVGAQPGHEGRVVVGVAARLQQRADGRHLALEGGIGGAALLVAPVRGDAELGVLVHVVGADLHFQGAAFGPDHRGVQRLVVVALGPRDVVVEFARHVRPQRVDHAQRGVAVGHVGHQHAQRADVVQVLEVDVLALHLLPDAVDVLGPAGDLGREAGAGQRRAERGLGLDDVALAVAAALVEQARDALVHVRLQVAEREVLHLPLDLPDAQAVGQRRVDVGGALGQRAALLLRQPGRRAQPHQVPREQDEDHPQVLDDRQQQAPQALGAGALAARAMQRPDLVGLALAVHQHRQRRRQAVDPGDVGDRRGQGLGIDAELVEQHQRRHQLALVGGRQGAHPRQHVGQRLLGGRGDGARRGPLLEAGERRADALHRRRPSRAPARLTVRPPATAAPACARTAA